MSKNKIEGFLRISNQLLGRILIKKFSKNELVIFFTLYRFSYGFNVPFVPHKVTQLDLARYSGLDKSAFSKGLAKLIKRNIAVKDPSNNIWINIDFFSWDSDIKLDNYAHIFNEVYKYRKKLHLIINFSKRETFDFCSINNDVDNLETDRSLNGFDNKFLEHRVNTILKTKKSNNLFSLDDVEFVSHKKTGEKIKMNDNSNGNLFSNYEVIGKGKIKIISTGNTYEIKDLEPLKGDNDE